MEHSQILITKRDRLRLSSLLEREPTNNRCAASLRAKVSHSTPVPTITAPRDLVTMNSLVRGVIKDEGWPDSDIVRILTLTYPHATKEADGCVSVLTPLGVELLGARVGDSVTWSEPEGRAKKMVIDEILFQPESSGDWHL